MVGTSLALLCPPYGLFKSRQSMAKLHFYYSAMNAGKSTTLLQSSYNYREKGMESLILVPSIGSRHEEGKISSRIGLESQAVNFMPQADLYKLVQEYINLSPNI